jgi:hypothetical protein
VWTHKHCSADLDKRFDPLFTTPTSPSPDKGR